MFAKLKKQMHTLPQLVSVRRALTGDHAADLTRSPVHGAQEMLSCAAEELPAKRH